MKTVITFDLDGTLIDSKNQIIGGDETLKLFARLKNKGVELLVNTGRLDHDAYYIMKKYGLRGLCRISQNGAVMSTEDKLVAELIDKEEAKLLYQELMTGNLRVELNTISNRYWHDERDPDFPKEYYDSSRILDDFNDVIEFQPVVLFLVIGDEEEIEKLQSNIKNKYSKIDAVKTSRTSLEILKKGVSKGDTILKMFPNTKIISIGDSENDFSMFVNSAKSYYVGSGESHSCAKKVDNILEALIDIEKEITNE